MSDKADRKSEGKPLVQLIEPEFILGIGAVLEMGARKYAPNNWKLSVNTEDHKAFVDDRQGSMIRHAMARLSGELRDVESGLPHMYHVACNAMFIDFYDDEQSHRGGINDIP